MAADLTLLRLARSAEDVASGLHPFRDNLPRSAARITSIISELFRISSVLRQIDGAQEDPRCGPSFYRIRDDLKLASTSLGFTCEDVFLMFGRSGDRTYSMVWDDLHHQMENEERMSLLGRLELYHDFLQAQFEIITGYRPESLPQMRNQLEDLTAIQDASQLQPDSWSIGAVAGSAARPRRPILRRLETPLSPTMMSDEWDEVGLRPPVPEAFSPHTQTNSSPTLSSSQTSYSNEAQSQQRHWAQQVFDGSNPGTQIRPAYHLELRSACYGGIDTSSLSHLGSDGFLRALELPFDGEQLWMRLYWRPQDNRARILIMTKDPYRRDLHYCTALNNLKIFRSGSCLQLCRAKRDGSFTLWAKLTFSLYERMVLLYCTLVAMKYQDRRPISHQALHDNFELEEQPPPRPTAANPLPPPPPPAAAGERELFGGEIHDGALRHALRIWQDTTSGVVRLEAQARRGPMSNVPLWTAFVTRYAHDPDWAHLEPGGRDLDVRGGAGGRGAVVSLAALRPPPYVFLSGYVPPRNQAGEWILPFVKMNDARQFMEAWAGLCRQSH